MTEQSGLGRRWWLTGVAALLAGIFLWDATGSWVVVGLIVACVAAAGWYSLRRKKTASARCLNCGESLKPNARQCNVCGSARWTVN